MEAVTLQFNFFGASFARIRERRAGLLLPEDRKKRKVQYLGLNEVDGDFYSGVNVTDDAASKIRSQHSLFSWRRR